MTRRETTRSKLYEELYELEAVVRSMSLDLSGYEEICDLSKIRMKLQEVASMMKVTRIYLEYPPTLPDRPTEIDLPF